MSAGAARSQEPAPAPVDSGLLEDWAVDSALAYYHEKGRIQAVEPVVDVAKVFADGQALNFNVTFDALSGASPNGALPSRTAPDICIALGEARGTDTRRLPANCRSIRTTSDSAHRGRRQLDAAVDPAGSSERRRQGVRRG